MAIKDGLVVSDREFAAYVAQQNSGVSTTEYPKMLYRPGPLDNHHLANEPLKIAGAHELQTLVVESADEELIAMEAGWSTDLAPTTAPAKKGAGNGNAA